MRASALLSSGLLAGAFFYGAVNATPPENHRALLARWEAFHFAGTACAVSAFVLLTGGTSRTGSDRATKEENS